MMLVKYLKVKISVERIVKFLGEPEVERLANSVNENDPGRLHSESEGSPARKHPGPVIAVGIENGNFLWAEPVVQISGQTASTTNPTTPRANLENLQEHASRQFQLRDINVHFPVGKLSIITGRTASGKTALLRALLGEMYTIQPRSSSTSPQSGIGSALQTKIYLPRKKSSPGLSDGISAVSYAAQTPWLEHLTIKENIIFGSLYDEARYKSVLDCCALMPDLEMFEDGDETEIGERGVSLSGGQKARYVILIRFRL